MFQIIFEVSCSFFQSYRLCTINGQTNFCMLCQHISTTKTLQTTFPKLCFLFVFYFAAKHKSVRIFNVYVKQQTHRVFKILIWNINWKTQLVFITIHINPNTFFHFNLAKIFFSYRKLNSIIIKIINKYFIFSRNSFLMYFCWIKMSNMTPKKRFLSLFLMLISPFLDLLTQQLILCKEFLIMIYKLKR